MTDNDRVADGCLVAMLRCETCKWWDHDEKDHENWGTCNYLPGLPAPKYYRRKPDHIAHSHDNAQVWVRRNFGCVVWRGKNGW